MIASLGCLGQTEIVEGDLRNVVDSFQDERIKDSENMQSQMHETGEKGVS